jgi:hypothetical protein
MFRASTPVLATKTAFERFTWLHRWALTKKMPNTFDAGEPGVPAFIAEAAKP